MSGGRGRGSARRVLLVSYEYPPLGGGGGVIVRDLAEELAERMEVSVLTSAARGRPRRESQGPLEIVRTPVLFRQDRSTASLPSMLSFFPSSLIAGARLLRRRQFDLVHSAFAIPSGPSGLLLARAFGLPHVLSLLGGDIYDPSKSLSPHRTPILKGTVRRVIRGSDRVIAGSRDIQERAGDLYGASGVETVPLAIRPPRVVPMSRAELGLPREAWILVTVGRLVPRKGLRSLVELLGELKDPQVRLVIVGDGPERKALEKRASAVGVAQQIHFAGYVSEERKWQLLAAADLYVSTSIHEGFGLVFLEALEAGLPVLCYDRGGQTDFLAAEVAELVPADDREDFRSRLRALLDDRAKRRQMGRAGRRIAREYHVDRFAERYRAIYDECLESAGDGRR